ncbi:MAG: DUF4214 domain-containing protein [Acidimicrobiia bacterium]|nr:DUF4214 domain-containing protein [Acidimicrobiia bacterium]
MAATVLVVAGGPAGAVPGADVSVALARTPNVGQAAIDEITYTATVTNAGPATAQDVAFVDPMGDLGPRIDHVATTKGTCDTEDAQVTCTIGSLTSGAIATVTISALLGASGLVTNTVAVTSSTADPDPDNNIASASVVLTQPPSFEELVVRGYFRLVLGLNATDAQVDHWVGEFEEYSYYNGDFALQLLKTYTFRSNWVTETYQKLLGRDPDAGGLALFTRQLSQRVTYEQIEATIAGSTEYYDNAGGTDGAFVDALVADLTGHAPPAAFRAELLDRLASGQSRTEVAHRVATSGLGRLAWLKWQYRRYFKREASSFELNLGLLAMAHGVRPARELATLLGDFEVIESFLPGYYYEDAASRTKAA